MKHVTPPQDATPLTDAERLAEGRRNLARLRKEAAGHIDRLIELLDLTEPDADLEDGVDDEASLAAATSYNGGDQTFWAAGNDEDLEDEHDGREPDDECDGRPDEEPSLGWPERVAQGSGLWGGSDDREAAAEPDVTDADRRAYFRKRHGNLIPIAGAEWKVG